MSRRSVLLLNRGESLVDIIDWQTAVCLLIKGNATIPYGYDDYHKIPISVNSAEKMKNEGNFEVTIEDEGGVQRGYFLLPTAIVLVEYVNIPYKAAAVNKRNVLKRDRYTCAYCGKALKDTTGTVDHIIPTSRWKDFVAKGLAKGHTANNWKNVVAACGTCNHKKDSKTPEEAHMKLKIKPFVPSRDYLIIRGINLNTYETWSRWITINDHLG